MNTILQKRIEGAARDFNRKEGIPYALTGHVFNAFIEGAIFALQNQWISVEEDLPNVDSNGYSNLVLVKCRFHPNDNIVATYSSLSNLWLSDGLRLEVTHWMEIPSLEGGEE